jgi:tRNA G18 (ribose-2'-O)-methylase SpoU
VPIVRLLDADDPRLDDYRALRGREREDALYAEGPTVVARLLTSGLRVRSVLLSDAAVDRIGESVTARLDPTVPVLVVDRDTLRAVVGFDLHRGAIALADRPQGRRLDDVVAGARRVVALEGINDHENLGAIARSGRALGVAALVLDPTCADPYYRRAVRVSMGEMLHLPIGRATRWPGALAELRAAGVTVAALTPAPDAVDIQRWHRPDGPLAILLGAEGPGLTAAAQHAADVRLRIATDPTVDSLNVGHAAAIAFALLR